MGWIQFLLFCIGTYTFLWNWKSENLANINALKEDTKANIAFLKEDIKAINAEMVDFHNAIKDLHGRLCSIEERHRKG